MLYVYGSHSNIQTDQETRQMVNLERVRGGGGG
jgi:hypothetical protein